MSALAAVGLTRRFGKLVAVNNLTFEVPAGGVVGFVGPNGSGKSTTIRVLLGLIAASSGTGTVLGEPIEHPERFAGRVGALIESPAFVGGLTGRDNLRSLAALRGFLRLVSMRCRTSWGWPAVREIRRRRTRLV